MYWFKSQRGARIFTKITRKFIDKMNPVLSIVFLSITDLAQYINQIQVLFLNDGLISLIQSYCNENETLHLLLLAYHSFKC